MPTLPWSTVPDAAPDGNVVVLASRLDLRSLRTVPAFLRMAMKVRKQVLASPGAVGVSLIAEPFAKTFWTLSAWADQASLDMFVASEPHLGVMRRFPPTMTGANFVTWVVSAETLPVAWDEAKRRLSEAGDQPAT